MQPNLEQPLAPRDQRIATATHQVQARPRDSQSDKPPKPLKIVILGGGVAGTNVAVELERLWKKRAHVEVTLVSRDNFYLMTPLLFEAASGGVEVRHVVNAIRPLLAKTRFVRAEVTRVDFDRRVVSARSDGGDQHELGYDHLVVALGGAPRYDLVAGARDAFAFKTIEDAIELRTHLIDMFERATLESDPAVRERLLRLVIVGGGLVGVELAGEMAHFLDSLRKTYKTIRRQEISVHVLQAGPRLVPELHPAVAAYIDETFASRGIRVRTNAPVRRIDPEEVELADGQRVPASTIVYAAGLAVSPLVASLPVERDGRGRVVTDSTMRSVSRPEVWALGDNAAIPVPDQPGQTYPGLAQHAHREAQALARNLARVLEGDTAKPYVARTLGAAALLGNRRAVIQVGGVRIRGFGAWALWRTIYLVRVPWERRLRLLADWTVALFFPADSAQLRLRLGVNRPAVSERAPSSRIA